MAGKDNFSLLWYRKLCCITKSMPNSKNLLSSRIFLGYFGIVAIRIDYLKDSWSKIEWSTNLSKRYCNKLGVGLLATLQVNSVYFSTTTEPELTIGQCMVTMTLLIWLWWCFGSDGWSVVGRRLSCVSGAQLFALSLHVCEAFMKFR